jgi:hypothetical protein
MLLTVIRILIRIQAASSREEDIQQQQQQPAHGIS